MNKLGFEPKSGALGKVIGTTIWGFIAPWIVESIWNWKAVLIFGSPHIGYWDAFWLIFMLRIIKGSNMFSVTDYVIAPVKEEA